MKRNFKLGLILGIAILMLLPVYARALIILNDLQGCIAPGTVANITASQGATISFVVTSRLPNLSMITNPDEGVATFQSTTNTFTWPTGPIGANPAVAAGSYLAAFQAHNNEVTEAEYLVVMITINSTGGSPPPAPTETISVSFSNPTTTGTSGQPVSFTASATSSLGGDSFQYNFIWGDGTSTGFGSVSTQSHTYNTTTTQTYTVTVQAKCSTHNVSGQASTAITITGSGGGGGSGSGTITNPIKINKPTDKVSKGYIPQNSPDGSRGSITVPAGSKVYFEVDPVATTGRSVSVFAVSVKFYSGAGTVCKLTQDKTTGAYSSEACQGSDSFMDIVYDGQPYPIANKKFLYAIDNSLSNGVANDEIWATIP